MYRVKSISILGKNNYLFRTGDVVTENDFSPNRLQELVDKKFIIPIPIEKTNVNHNPIGELPIRIAVITAMWKRPEVFKMFAEQLNKIIGGVGDSIKIEVFVSGSEANTSKNLCESFGFNYIEKPNRPLGAKMNAALNLSRDFNPHYFLLLGSDDIFCEKLMNAYYDCILKRVQYAYLEDCYFYDTVSGSALYWGGYSGWRKGKGLGAGRFISREIVEHLGWSIWSPLNNKNLDYSFDQRMRIVNCKTEKINLQNIGAYMVDLKSETSITRFYRYENTTEINPKILINKFKL